MPPVYQKREDQEPAIEGDGLTGRKPGAGGLALSVLAPRRLSHSTMRSAPRRSCRSGAGGRPRAGRSEPGLEEKVVDSIAALRSTFVSTQAADLAKMKGTVGLVALGYPTTTILRSSPMTNSAGQTRLPMFSMASPQSCHLAEHRLDHRRVEVAVAAGLDLIGLDAERALPQSVYVRGEVGFDDRHFAARAADTTSRGRKS